MAYERVQKSFGQSSSQKKQSPIVPPLNEQQTQADSQPSPKVKLSRLPSKEERDAIRRSLFEKWANVPQKEDLTNTLQQDWQPTFRQHFGGANITEANQIQEAPASLSVAGAPIQAKLTIGKPGDKYEQEAERVAAQVVSQINAPAPPQSVQSQSGEREATQKKVTNLSNQNNVNLNTIQCVEQEDSNQDNLTNELKELFQSKKVFEKGGRFNTYPPVTKLTKKILDALKEKWGEEKVKELIKTPQFAWAYQAAASSVSGAEDISITEVGTDNDAVEGNWTLRHYTDQKYDVIRNNIDLVNDGIKDPEKSNTRQKDYAYGTPPFTFFVIAINGKVPNRGFLKNSPVYYEISLDDVTEDLWIGGDIISAQQGSKKITYRGKGKDIKNFLINKGIGSVDELDNAFEQFEVKYPGNVDTTTQGKWH